MEEQIQQEQAAETGSGGKKLFQRKPGKGKKAWVRLGVAAAAITVLAFGVHMVRASDKTVEETAYTTAEASRQSLTRTLSSSGTLQPADSYIVKTLVSGEVLSDTFEEGDIVEKDQLLYTLDASDASTSQTQAANSYSQAQKSYNKALKSKTPSADISGTVETVYVTNGDTVSAGAELVKLVGGNNITMDFLFSYVDSSEFYTGQSATIFIDGLEGTVTGTVAAVSQSGTADASGRMNTTVRVTAVNPGLVLASYTASAVIGSYSSYGQAAVKISASSVITAEVSGKITGMSLLPGDYVSEGQKICTITGDTVDDQIDSARISLENAATSLENAKDKLEDYQVTAPISGTVVTKTAKVGDNIEGGSAGTLCTIYDMSYLEMTMNIDELDIADVSVGQTVQITADAVDGRTYTGEVTKVSVAGTTSGGITTYPVTVRIKETDGLLPGMNVDAEIVVAQSDNALAIPTGAVSRGNLVLITAGSPSAANALEQEAPDGYVYVQVETGVDDDSYIEIISGLQEGDTVAYIQTSSSSGAMMMNSMAMSGGMPGGGEVRAAGGPSGGGGGFPG